jgi:hypothetical protein
VKKG